MEENRDIEEIEMIIEGSNNEVKTFQEGIYDYNEFTNKPAINRNVLKGNKTSTELGLVGKTEFDNEVSKLRQENENKTNAVKEELVEQTGILEQNLRNEIAVIKQENQVLKQQNQKNKDQLPSGVASGNSIYLDDSSDMELEVQKINGGHRQETRSGKNKLKVKNGKNINRYGLNVSIDDSGIITINGTANGYYPTFLISGDGNIEVRNGTPSITDNESWYNSIQLANQEYTLKFEYISGTGGSNARPYIYIHKSDGTNSEFTQGNTTKIKNYTGDISGVSFYVNDATTYNNFKFRLYIVEGTYTSSNIPPFEPYGVSPSPDFPSEIETVNGSVEIDVVNKNIMPDYDCEVNNMYGITAILKKNKISVKGTVSETNYPSINLFADGSVTIKQWWATKIGINSSKGFFGNDKVSKILSFLIDGTLSSINTTLSIGYETHVDRVDYISIGINKKILDINEKVNFISFGFSPNSNIDLTIELQLEKGTIATEFVTHQSQTAIMPIQQEMLEGDYIDLENEKEHHEWGKLEITGTEEQMWQEAKRNDNNIVFQFLERNSDKGNWTKGFIYSNMFISGTGNSVWQENTGRYLCGIDDIHHIRFSVPIEKFNNLDSFKEYLKSLYNAGTPIILYYKLATPLNLELTETQKSIQKLNTYKNITNINLSDDLASVDVGYKKDSNTINNKLQTQIDELKQLLSTTQTSALLLDNLQKDVESEVE